MINAVPEKKVAKVSVMIDDDINLILDAIIKVEPAYVMLIIPEGNDLINSPIGLKALRKKTLEKEKRMILVVPKGMAHELATGAGFTATVAQEGVTPDLWQTVESKYQEYKLERVGMPSKTNLHGKKKEKEDSTKVKKTVEYISGDKKESTREAPPEIISNKSHQVVPPVSNKVPLSKNEESSASDQNENLDAKKASIGPNVTGMDFSKFMRGGNAAPLFTKKTKPITVSPKQAEKAAEVKDHAKKLDLDVLPKKIGSKLSTVAKKKKKKKATPVARFFMVALIGLSIMLVGVFIAYSIYFPGVRVDIYAESYLLEMSDEVLATSAVTGFDANRKEIQLTKEIVPKSGIKKFTATEAGVEGTKATGQIQFQNSSTSEVTIPAGTEIVFASKKFTNLVEVKVPTGDPLTPGSKGQKTVQGTATEFGEEYNIPATTSGAISGFTGIEVETATAFTGGDKRTFKVVGQKEVDETIKALTKELEVQAISDLELSNLDNGYEFIRNSVNTKVKDGTKIDPAVGGEVADSDEIPIVTIETETTGLYYHAASLEKLVEQLLVEQYLQEKSIAPKDAINTVIEDLEVTVSEVVLGKDDKVTIKFNAKGLATYHLDDDKIAAELAGHKPEELAEYLAKLPGLSKAADIFYTPSWFPEFLRYVPKEASRIDVRIDVVEPVVQETEE